MQEWHEQAKSDADSVRLENSKSGSRKFMKVKKPKKEGGGVGEADSEYGGPSRPCEIA